ncbi:cysteine desulfurase family protein [Aerococcus kribbianus]|uniref:cysteine desulfurase n=1 Tax=Aerococcus kribbianus TaxID=2999064 RepID=A0A9X3FMW0_9LACT|nr:MULTISPECIES: cysteine desulfurase family protein [unclassified Aerococcus]MCZ0716693.1 cysteine desulfurase family protein [Aerococcus sp. YH-aer221]MCZ0724981.1 cysteine desulfurase family protein [Aerococcus sp. YH-aer222]
MTGVYLDYAATTPMSPQVIEAMTQAMKNHYGNASSLYKIGRDSRHIIEETRQLIAKTLNANPADIIINSGGTEANNSAIVNALDQFADRGKHIITSQAEHSSVYQTIRALEAKGYPVTYLDFDEDGHIALEALKQAIRPDTVLVSIMAGNNEVGSLQDLQSIGDLLAEKDIFFHTDTVQTYLNYPLNVEALHIDALSMSAHKLYGPKGIGFLYYRDADKHFVSYIKGGNQENKHRAGTESIPQIVGMKTAIELANKHQKDHQAHLLDLRYYLLDQAEKRGLDFQINGPQDAELAHILNLYWPGHASDIQLIKFDLADIYLSAGSACTAGSLEPSRVLVSMYGEDSPRIQESLRVSFGQPTSKAEIDQFLDRCEENK